MSQSNKVVIATYTVSDCFYIPSNIDLENKDQVEYWYVKYNTLYIKLVNRENKIQIDNQGWVQNNDLKYPKEAIIDDAEANGVDTDDSGFEPFEPECCETCGLGFYDLEQCEQGGNWCKCDEQANRLYDLLSKAEDPKQVLQQAVDKMLKELDEQDK